MGRIRIWGCAREVDLETRTLTDNCDVYVRLYWHVAKNFTQVLSLAEVLFLCSV